jgi:uncharacterized protein (TIGR02996 family)
MFCTLHQPARCRAQRWLDSADVHAATRYRRGVDASEHALLAAIIANPDDDELRFVYADSLERRGDLRGELIQLQCRLASGTAPDAAAAAARVTELLRVHGTDWLAPLLAIAPTARFGFARGFVEDITGHFPVVTVGAEALLALAPLLSRLELTIHGQRERGELARPRSTALLARARQLTIRGRHRGNTRGARGPIADLRQLATLPFVQLRALRLESLRTRPDELDALLRSPALAGLESLGLVLHMPAGEVRVIAPAIASLPLRSLDLSGNTLDGAALVGLFSSGFSRLESLVLGYNVSEQVVRAFRSLRPELHVISG